MAAVTEKSFDHPDEVRTIPNGKVEVVNIDGRTAMRATFQPGWRWSESLKPIVNTESCQVSHFGYMVSGRMGVKMDDGVVSEMGPGAVAIIPAGHDAWVVGDEPVVFVDFPDSTQYAVPAS